jgi:CubicO group peptidase (beta-lactamase class C family)
MLKDNQIREMAQALMNRYQVPGVALSIVQDEDILFRDAFGVADLHTQAAADQNTLFYIASATKAFTALSLALLVEDGLLKWDEPLKNTLPDFETADAYMTDHITLIDVLAHRTGIAELPILGDAKVTRKALYERLKEYAPNQAFRTTFQYSNCLYAIAGYLVELVAGRQWEDFVAERILSVLDMHHSDFAFLSHQGHPNRSRLYYMDKDRLQPYVGAEDQKYDTWGPAGSIHANSLDMGNWLLFWVNRGVFKGKRLISEDNFTKLITPHTIAWGHDKDFSTACYCLGWVSQWYKGEQVLWHNGSLGSYVSFLPDRRLGISVLTNRDSNLAKELTYTLVDQLP